ncbi:TonB-dependent receptor [Massilia sp. B-10]|nr:TonB-dependent receptor [Massilia sp. B-10]
MGQNGYRRAAGRFAARLGQGHLLYALEGFHNDGPFTRGDDFRKFNGVLRYSRGTAADGLSLTAMAYRARWNATDQIPLRAVRDGRLGRFDQVDASDGGAAHRYSLSGSWRASTDAGASALTASLVASLLDLYSNFTYFLDDPVNGDQFSQPDRRVTAALNGEHRWGQQRIGFQFQNDNIYNGLYRTVARRRLATTRADHIVETSAALFYEVGTRWSAQLRSVAGVRADGYRFQVASDLAANSGRRTAQLISPSLSLVFGPWNKTELYLNAGRGFHSNDARGTTQRIDPASGAPAAPVTPLARATGVELGVRSEAVAGWQSALSLYRLDVASELVFVGDAGTTEAGRPSRRTGIELSSYYKPNHGLTLDADLAFARLSRCRCVRPGASPARSKAWPRWRLRSTISGPGSGRSNGAISARDR